MQRIDVCIRKPLSAHHPMPRPKSRRSSPPDGLGGRPLEARPARASVKARRVPSRVRCAGQSPPLTDRDAPRHEAPINSQVKWPGQFDCPPVEGHQAPPVTLMNRRPESRTLRRCGGFMMASSGPSRRRRTADERGAERIASHNVPMQEISRNSSRECIDSRSRVN